jgi:hypothetical protein
MTGKKTQSKTRAIVTAPKRAVAGKANAGPVKRAQATSSPGAKTAPNPASAPAGAAPAGDSRPKAKLVRDSFTIPKSEYVVLESLKVRAANLTRPAKKSELLRAGIGALKAMSDAAFLAALSGVPSLKTGRPKGAQAIPAAGKRVR